MVIAVGGNCFEGLEHATAKNILSILKSGHLPVITHGNGLQVGKLLEDHPEKTVAKCVHKTQVEMGNRIKEELLGLAKQHGKKIEIEVIPTRVLVDPQDPAFRTPTKGIGQHYTLSQLQKMPKDSKNKTKLLRIPEGNLIKVIWPGKKKGINKEWIMKEVEGENVEYRRVVASPKPLGIHPQDFSRIRDNISQGKIVIAVGGGGVPIAIESTAEYVATQAVEAVIDKDLASALLARDLQARDLIISTGVREVALNWKKKNQVDIGYMQARQALKYVKKGQFEVGSMGEKMEAAINALRFGVNTVLITSPESNWANDEGTLLTRGIDLTGRFKNMVRRKPYPIQRWLVTQEGSKSASVGSALTRYSRPRPFQS
jgi:carbamate kinase